MDPGTLVGLGVLWLVFSLASRAGRRHTPKQPGRPARPHPLPVPKPPIVVRVPATTAARRAPPAEGEAVDRDEEAAGVAARRIAEAERRNRELGPDDHAEFDRRIRAEAADHTAVRRPRLGAEQLREAVVWREILGPPRGLEPGE